MFSLKRTGAAVVILVVAWLGLQRVASAQPSPLLVTQGVLSGAACDDASCVTLTATITMPGGTRSFTVSREGTAVWVGTERVSPAILDRFTGTPAIVLSAPMGSKQVAGRIDILVFPAQGRVSLSASNNASDHGNSDAAKGESPNGGTSGGGNSGGGNSGGGNSGGGNSGGGNSGGGNSGGGNSGGGNSGGTHGNGQDNGQGTGSGEHQNNGHGHDPDPHEGH
jgi:hypothetical protein